MPRLSWTKKLGAALLSAAVGLTSACSTLTQADLAKREDYLPAMALHGGGDTSEAARELPAKESGGFLATLEHGWLGVASGTPDPSAMVAVGRDLEERKTLSLSRESKAYFYKETEDGYYPAEHEAIVFHIVAGFAFLQKGSAAEAAVEARKASFYLQSAFGTAGAFDDPALRLWLAALWSACGDWESARVDLRGAARFGAAYAWARALAERAKPPRTLVLVLAGPGPDLKWTPSLKAGPEGMQFVPGIAAASYDVGGLAVAPGTPTLPWYQRHVERDFALRRILNQSRYMAEGIAPAAATGAILTAGIAVGVAVITLGVVGGAAIIYYGVRAGFAIGGDLGGDIAAGSIIGGTVVGVFAVKGGLDVLDTSEDLSEQILERGFSPVSAYRYARFLPDLVALAATDRALSSEDLRDAKGRVVATPFLRVARAGKSPSVLAYFTAGSAEDLARAALLTRWLDTQHHNDWIMLGKNVTYADAKAACATLNRTLPTWTEMLDARTAGLTRLNLNEAFASRLEHVAEIWTRDAEEDATPGRCRSLTVVDFSEGATPDCAKLRAALCVGHAP